jgi:hypothetical protein
MNTRSIVRAAWGLVAGLSASATVGQVINDGNFLGVSGDLHHEPPG